MFCCFWFGLQSKDILVCLRNTILTLIARNIICLEDVKKVHSVLRETFHRKLSLFDSRNVIIRNIEVYGFLPKNKILN